MSLKQRWQNFKNSRSEDATQDAASSRGQTVKQEITGQHFVSSLCSDYENLFPQIRPLINEMKMVHPFGLGRNGARIPISRTPELAALEYPNENMGWDEFIDLVFATWLTEREALIRVHKTARGKVYGYTVLPVGCRKWVGNEERFSFITNTGESIDIPRDEVMVLRFSRSPKNPDQGVSPATVAHFWAQIQDLLAQYQKAYLENGAVPASITFITASSEEKYLSMRRELEGKLSGASNKNKTIYAWRHLLPNNQAGDQIEVKTIQGNNSTLAIQEIMNIASDQLNKAVGVSNFILGDDSSAKYDNAELSTQQFMLHRVYPALVSFWNQFQHELDRIVGGLGYSISFDLEIPELTEQVKVKAETEKVRAEIRKTNADIENEKVRLKNETAKATADTLITLLDAGATPETAVAALGLSAEWLEVAQGIARGAELRTETGQVSDITTSSESQISGHLSDNCPHCHNEAKRTNDAYEPEFSPDETIQRGIYDELVELLEAIMNRELEGQAAMSEDELANLVERIEERLVEVAGKGAVDSLEQTTASINKLPTAVIVGMIKGKRPTNRQELVENIENEKTAEGKIDVSASVKEKLKDREKDIIKKYADEAAAKIQETLKAARAEGLTKAEISKRLQESLPRARAEMIARNETINAFRVGQLDYQKALAKKYSLKIEKTWRAHSGACPICAVMNGTTAKIDEPFPAEQTEKDGVVYAWEHSVYNEGGETPNAHVNCTCDFSFEVVG